VTQSNELRVTQKAVARPFHERHLDNDLGFHPPQSRHVFRRYALAPMASLATRKIDKRTRARSERRNHPGDLRSRVWREACTDFAGEVQLFPFVVPDQE